MEENNKTNSAETATQSAPNETSQSSAPCKFIKPRRNPNLRQKKTTSTEAEEENTVVVVHKEKETTKSSAFVQSTKDLKKVKETFTYESNPSAVPTNIGQHATAVNEFDTERDQDAVAIRERALKAQVEGQGTDGLYKGQAMYSQYIKSQEQSGLSKGTGIKAGPVRGSLYMRSSKPIDYQPHVCKDYKETGYCGFGDSCKFMHDRGDYKSSVELEKEWEEEQARKRVRLNEKEPTEAEKKLEGVPFACSVCRGPFRNPVKSKCKHYFCEQCGLPLDVCTVCGERTGKQFTIPSLTEKKKLEEARALYESQNPQQPTGDN